MTEADFLAAIIANPDDDAPRLIFADWLAENGQDDRAEFIRVQCKLARTLARAAELRRERRERDAGGKRGDGRA